MLNVSESQISAIGQVLSDKNRPLKERFRALFTLKNIGGPQAIEQIHKCFKDESALLKHELAYCLGQMQDPRAIPILTEILEDVAQEPMVRHEAGTLYGTSLRITFLRRFPITSNSVANDIFFDYIRGSFRCDR